MVEVSVAHPKKDIATLLGLGGEIDIAVAYIDRHGMKIIRERVKSNSRITKVRLLVDLKGGATDPEAVKRMVGLSQDEEDRFKCKEYYTEEHPHAGLHAKLLIASGGNSVTFLTGSCNLTKNAIERNREHGVRVECGVDTSLGREVLGYFKGLWDSSHAKKITYERYCTYKEFYEGAQAVEKNKGTLSPPAKQLSGVKYWLFKCDLKEYNFKKLLAKAKRDSTQRWGRKGPASKWIREIKKGDEVLFYESGAKAGEVVGTAQVVRAWDDLEPKLHNPSKPDKQWPRVDIKADRKFKVPVPLATLRDMGLKDRLSIQEVNEEQWNKVIEMGTGTSSRLDR